VVHLATLTRALLNSGISSPNIWRLFNCTWFGDSVQIRYGTMNGLVVEFINGTNSQNNKRDNITIYFKLS
jgi:hypothetical protein